MSKNQRATSMSLDQIGKMPHKEWDEHCAEIELGQNRLDDLKDVEMSMEEAERRKTYDTEKMKQKLHDEHEEERREEEKEAAAEAVGDEIDMFLGVLAGVGAMLLTGIGVVLGYKSLS